MIFIGLRKFPSISSLLNFFPYSYVFIVLIQDNRKVLWKAQFAELQKEVKLLVHLLKEYTFNMQYFAARMSQHSYGNKYFFSYSANLCA